MPQKNRHKHRSKVQKRIRNFKYLKTPGCSEMEKIFKIFSLLFLAVTSTMLSQESNIIKLNLVPEKLPFGLVKYTHDAEPKTALVLSGGGARGLAHIGVLRALEEKNIPIKYIIGTSMGSIVGGLYAAGYSIDELDSIAVNTNWDDFYSAGEADRREQFYDQKITNDKALFAIRLDGLNPILPTSVSSGQKVSNLLTLLSLNAPIQTDNSFNDLKYDFYAVCTDLISGNKVVLNEGSLGLAMRASSSVMFLLSPVEMDSLQLVDGGLVANIPVGVAKEINSDFIIASDATSPLYNEEDLAAPWKVADQLISIPMMQLNKLQLSLADVVVNPVPKGMINSNFKDVDSLLVTGYDSTNSIIENIEEKYREKYYSKINIDDKVYSNVEFICDSETIKNHFLHLRSKSEVSKKDLIFILGQLNRDGGYKSLSIEIEEDENTNIKIIALENPIIRNIKIEGTTFLSDSILSSLTTPLLNKSYSSKRALDLGMQIIHEYRNAGVTLAKISSIDFEEDTGNIEIKIEEKIVSEIRVTGNEKTNASVIAREFSIEENDYLTFDNLKKGLANLRATDLFESVDIQIDDEGDETILNIIVQEKISSLLRFGLRIDNVDFTQVSLDLRDENVLGTGTELGTILFYGDRKKSLTLEHRANRIFDTYLTYKIKTYFNLDDVNVYEDVTPLRANRIRRDKTSEYRQLYLGASFGIGSQFQKFGNIFIEGKYEKNEVKNKFDFAEEKTFKMDIASLKFSLSIDSQNKYPYPTFGSRLNSYYETGLSVFGAKTGFTKFYFDYKGYFSIGEDHTLAPKFVIGFADETLPLSQQFSLGGQRNFFGLREDEYRGRQILTTSLEYQFVLPVQLFFDAFFRVRYDLGSIWSQQEQIRFKDLRHGIGATLSLDTPIGPADFSIGRSFIIERALPDNVIKWGQVFFYFTIGYYY